MPDSEVNHQSKSQGNGGDRPYLIVLGNEKGGSGKSTTAMHIVVALLHEGYRVGTIDLDARQRSLTPTTISGKVSEIGVVALIKRGCPK